MEHEVGEGSGNLVPSSRRGDGRLAPRLVSGRKIYFRYRRKLNYLIQSVQITH